MLYLLCTLLDLSVVELAEHSPRPFGQRVCVHPRRPFGRGVQERGGGGRLLETSRRLESPIVGAKADGLSQYNYVRERERVREREGKERERERGWGPEKAAL